MGYFANGTEGGIFFDKYCVRCVHCGGCPIWDLHQMWNYDQISGIEDEIIPPAMEMRTIALDMLMPRGVDKLTNTCSMFYPTPVPSLPDENKQIITVETTREGTREIEACVYGDFATHRTTTRGRSFARTFTVTHLPTRLAVQIGLSIDDAINLAKRLDALEVDTSFDSTSGKEYEAFAKLARPIVQEYR